MAAKSPAFPVFKISSNHMAVHFLHLLCGWRQGRLVGCSRRFARPRSSLAMIRRGGGVQSVSEVKHIHKYKSLGQSNDDDVESLEALGPLHMQWACLH